MALALMASPAHDAPAAPGVAVGMTAKDYDARRCTTCIACGSAAIDRDADYCRRCALVAQMLRAWGAGEVSRRLALVAPTLPREGAAR